MIRIKKARGSEPVRTTMELGGEPFEIELTPLTDEASYKAFVQFQERKYHTNPVTRRTDVVEVMKQDPAVVKVTENLAVGCIVNFWGIADEDGNELDGSAEENKRALVSIIIESNEPLEITDGSGDKVTVYQTTKRPFANQVIEKARELAGAVLVKEAEHVKN